MTFISDMSDVEKGTSSQTKVQEDETHTHSSASPNNAGGGVSPVSSFGLIVQEVSIKNIESNFGHVRHGKVRGISTHYSKRGKSQHWPLFLGLHSGLAKQVDIEFICRKQKTVILIIFQIIPHNQVWVE